MCDDKTSCPGRWKACFSLFRPPNLLTVPGDPLTGAMLASVTRGILPDGSGLVSVLGASLLLYAGGLLANDFFDRYVDARERPGRPIPSGIVRPAFVLGLAIILTLAALAVVLPAGRTTLTFATLVALASWFYNAVGKRLAWLAPFSMGACRGLSLMMGAALLGVQGTTRIPVLFSGVMLTLFIALVTHAARHEADPGATSVSGSTRWGIPLLIAMWVTGIILTLPSFAFPPLPARPSVLAIILAAMSILWALVWSLQLTPGSKPRAIQAAIGGMIRGLILTQATLCACCGSTGEACALVLVVCFPVSGWLGKWFYGS